ncbi:pyridoxamine 5'-phosphate oxidase family protein [Haloferax profundi]|uniref:Flavin-nucleotide-binding protein n=1 Tax=Haloferax profundi TaxID=1544718 RepID=A0A0W1SV24_9EURY|nr:pyridoxamine 5'-phosphate oxidase family protein [Haloferax profundi]KTG30280.1 hypothetical protein AUR66_08545 [Haloferax profundi]
MQRASTGEKNWVEHGRVLNDDIVDEVLREQGHGVLSIAIDGDVYARPMSFGYDGQSLYFQLAAPPGSPKSEFAECGVTAELVISEFESVDDWHSVVVRGELTGVPNGDEVTAFEAIADNAVFPQNAIDTGECQQFELARLAIESAEGRVGPSASIAEAVQRRLGGPQASD